MLLGQSPRNKYKAREKSRALYFNTIEKEINMLGWILFVGLICFIFGIVAGWFLCIWGLAHYAANGILNKEENEQTK